MRKVLIFFLRASTLIIFSCSFAINVFSEHSIKSSELKNESYKQRCEGKDSNSPFASLKAVGNSRLKLRIEGNEDMGSLLLQANEKNCLWHTEMNTDREEIALPKLLPEGKFRQNPENPLQYLLFVEEENKDSSGLMLIIDFETHKCISQVASIKRPLRCVDPTKVAPTTEALRVLSSQLNKLENFIGSLE